jgi:hypothetical protein
MSHEEYEKMIRGSEQAYRQFMKDLIKKPTEDNKATLDFNN